MDECPHPYQSVPIVCVNRPNRTNPRPFSEKDLERIAGYVNRDGISWLRIIAVILVTSGFAVLFCRFARAIENVLGILRIIREIAAVLAATAAINAIIIWLSRAKNVPIPIVSTIIGWLLVLFLAIRALAKGAAGLASDLETIEDSAGWVSEICDHIGDILTLRG